MEKPSKELLGAIALVLAIVAAGHLWAGAADACALKTGDLAAEIRKANGCLEFWANRYQTAWAGLLGASAALSAAWVAWHSIQVQIKRDEKAAGEAAQRNQHFERQQIEREITTLNSIGDRVTAFQEEMASKMGGESPRFAHALSRVVLPSPVGLLMIPGSRANDGFMLWTQRLQELKNHVQQQLNVAGLSNPVPLKIQDALHDANARIHEAVREGVTIRREAVAEIDRRERRLATLGQS